MRGKYRILLFSITIIGVVSCKKNKIETTSALVPYLEIKFGYYRPFNLYITPYVNQDSIALDSVKSHEYFDILFIELNHPNSFRPEVDSINYKFDVQTKNDIEHFDSREAGRGSRGLDIDKTTKVEAESNLIYKISSIATPGNDTLEISPAGDFIKIDCVSSVSGLKGSAKLKILP